MAVIVVIIARKFPQLSLLDVDSIPEVKVGKKKTAIIKKRIEKKAEKTKRKRQKHFVPITNFFKKKQLQFREYVGKVERGEVKMMRDKKQKEISKKGTTEQAEVSNLLRQAKTNYAEKDWEAAEEGFISIIRIDPGNQQAYQGLGDVYFDRGDMEQAKETYEFLIQLDKENDDVLARLADIEEKQGNLNEAVKYYQKAIIINPNLANRFFNVAEILIKMEENETALEALEQAVELEPENPKYLDKLVETSIMVGDKKGAKEAYNRLRLVNPENQKLIILKEKIDKVS